MPKHTSTHRAGPPCSIRTACHRDIRPYRVMPAVKAQTTALVAKHGCSPRVTSAAGEIYACYVEEISRGSQSETACSGGGEDCRATGAEDGGGGERRGDEDGEEEGKRREDVGARGVGGDVGAGGLQLPITLAVSISLWLSMPALLLRPSPLPVRYVTWRASSPEIASCLRTCYAGLRTVTTCHTVHAPPPSTPCPLNLEESPGSPGDISESS